jgi:hypothetical protein
MASSNYGDQAQPGTNGLKGEQAQSSFPGTVRLALAALFFVLALVIWQLHLFPDPQVRKFVVYAFVAGFATLLTFGVLRSSGVLRSQRWGVYVELGGSAAMLVAVLGIGLHYDLLQPRDAFAITIYLVSSEDQRTPIKSDGKVTLLTNPPRHSVFHEGIAEFRELPMAVNDQDVDYTVEVAGYQLSPDARKKLKLQSGASILLPLRALKPETVQPGPVIPPSPDIVIEKPGTEFFTEQELADFANKRLISYKNERVQEETLVVFKTKAQQTWLFATKYQVFMILDSPIDETGNGRRASLLRTIPLDKDMKAEVGDGSQPGSVVFSLNKGDAWTFYSPSVLGEPNRARQRIQLFIDSALDRQKTK